jgi:hypothetical protein
MSARDFIKEIPALSDEELKLVEAALRERRERDAATQSDAAAPNPMAGRKLSHDEAMDYVFTNFAPVLAKLAQ